MFCNIIFHIVQVIFYRPVYFIISLNGIETNFNGMGLQVQ